MLARCFILGLLTSSTFAVFDKSVITMTRFNCAFPLCPTTALDVVSLDEHYELGRPHILATLIEQTPTAEMNFQAYSAFDNSTRSHYTLAARAVGGEATNSLFTVIITANGTSGSLSATSTIVFPPTAAQADITYFFTNNGIVYIAFRTGILLSVSPSTGSVNASTYLPAGLIGTLACVFDAQSRTLYANALGSGGSFLTSFSVATMTSGATVGPLPATPNTGAGPNGERIDVAVAQLAVRSPATAPLRLMELRTSIDFPWIFMAFLDPVSGNSTEIALPDDWYKMWDIDPEIFPEQWLGSTHRVWDYDPVNNRAWFKLYDECDQADDCDEDESIVYLQWATGCEKMKYLYI